MPVSLAPNLMVRDVRAAIAFYCDHLGFTLVMAVPDGVDDVVADLSGGERLRYAMMQAGSSSLMVQARDSLIEELPALAATDPGRGASLTLYVEVEDLDAVMVALPAGIPVVRPVATSWYGMRELYIRDPDGYIVGLAQRVG